MLPETPSHGLGALQGEGRLPVSPEREGLQVSVLRSTLQTSFLGDIMGRKGETLEEPVDRPLTKHLKMMG